eukprot:TRINITY_DN63217_c0_g1_i1.p1 TRINITY_DN63217_c0_g1~~TRINITY_DN63217_c0_g1_i1.p1  ORF type:complete len:618 (+),score=106.05 TRINITY_DN63217_c0_g1_i1:83-1936(+)
MDVVAAKFDVATAATPTDTLRISSGEFVDFEAAVQSLQRFGSTASVEVLAGREEQASDTDGSFIEVTFFDVRATAKAHEFFGRDLCQYAPSSTLVRVARLKGAMRISDDDVCQVARVDDTVSGEYDVTFYDSRDALRYNELAKSFNQVEAGACPSVPPPGLEQPPGLDVPPGLSTPPGFKTLQNSVDAPPGLEGIRTPTVAASPAPLTAAAIGEVNGESAGADRLAFALDDASTACLAAGLPDAQCQVRLNGIPNCLLADPLLEAALEQAGLRGSIITFTATPKDPFGEVLVTLSSAMAAAQCVQHFDGCQWDTSGILVSTEVLIPSQGGVDVCDGRLFVERNFGGHVASQDCGEYFTNPACCDYFSSYEGGDCFANQEGNAYLAAPEGTCFAGQEAGEFTYLGCEYFGLQEESDYFATLGGGAYLNNGEAFDMASMVAPTCMVEGEERVACLQESTEQTVFTTDHAAQTSLWTVASEPEAYTAVTAAADAAESPAIALADGVVALPAVESQTETAPVARAAKLSATAVTFVPRAAAFFSSTLSADAPTFVMRSADGAVHSEVPNAASDVSTDVGETSEGERESVAATASRVGACGANEAKDNIGSKAASPVPLPLL